MIVNLRFSQCKASAVGLVSFVLYVSILVVPFVHANEQQPTGTVVSDTKEKAAATAQANNPLAKMTAFNIQNYFIGDISNSDDSANQFWLRYAKPFSVAETPWLLRASLPVNSMPTSSSLSNENGLGDLNMFAAYLLDTGDPAISFGIGPQITLPTASKSELGSEKWSAGLVNVLFNAESHTVQYGYLLSWQHSFAGKDDRADVNVAAFQPFGFYQLGGGTYLRAAPIFDYNLQSGDYNIPVGIGIGQVIKKGSVVYNFFVEPQISAARRGDHQEKWQVFLGLNLQFLE
ncbi:hypothetical protein SYK_15320 [Pseudodesulfovibrio nedwellii]|uniref:Neuromedin U n=1 Tax=Pseudodesulfovibrio nedwellii TaxID=2973072 RepID=A0ABM8B0S3_9BACT|nr:hypothetical protein [Pseudodesulfovibrio nedwellii]BDQ37172.1 hypothetical protein SYK_15320 [Pseudodesulfovibrio nedwellii]